MSSSMIRPYLTIFTARFLMLLQYRAAAFAGIVTQFWFGAIMVMVLAAFYAGGRGSPSITLGPVPASAWALDLVSFASYGPQDVTIDVASFQPTTTTFVSAANSADGYATCTD